MRCMDTLNIAAYKFVALGDLPAVQSAVLQQAQAHELKGTVLLAEEGINLFLAGDLAAINRFLAWLQADARFADLQVKQSWSSCQPFKKLRVKVKPEIIRMNHPTIRPSAGRAPAVDAPTLKRWLDQGHDDAGRPVVTLDTRNAFEVDVGTFEGAIDWRINKFSDFPHALQYHQAELAGNTVVSFCTGGIRCEKAAILMQQAGVEQVFQLDGGILKYLETVGRTHFSGDCFVFDARRAVDDQLAPQVDSPPPSAASADSRARRTV